QNSDNALSILANIFYFILVCTIMDTYKSKDTVISKQYSIKDAQNSK
ncbi:16632_t:CDS:2, partial [Dentiscutata heterogama]